MSILLNKYYKIYLEKGLKEPEKILQFTRNYKDDPNNHYKKFTIDCIITQDGENLKYSDAWNTYQKWVSEEGKDRGSKSKFLEYMNKKYGNLSNGQWSNITIHTFEEAEEDDMQESLMKKFYLDLDNY